MKINPTKITGTVRLFDRDVPFTYFTENFHLSLDMSVVEGMNQPGALERRLTTLEKGAVATREAQAPVVPPLGPPKDEGRMAMLDSTTIDAVRDWVYGIHPFITGRFDQLLNAMSLDASKSVRDLVTFPRETLYCNPIYPDVISVPHVGPETLKTIGKALAKVHPSLHLFMDKNEISNFELGR
jgi:hypothetical protein